MENNLKQVENKVLHAIEQAEEKVEAAERSILKNKWVRGGSVAAAVAVICGGLIYWQMASTRVGIDTSVVSAPIIGLSPSAPGQLQETYVHEGDIVGANKPVAKVGNEIIKTKIAGQITNVDMEIGKTFNPGQAVVSMVDPSQLKIIGTIDENKGLDKIRVGQLASFTVDAFGSKTFYGAVEEVSPSSKQSDVVFNISDARPVNQFNIKVRFNQSGYPEIKNGMSAKLTIFTK